ncbi:MAG: family 20 glycosylhydrolase [Verrucomicrobiae bacterium]|nr:family 20 glycosylhydrolase [Verrucomicrobiae bacterium]
MSKSPPLFSSPKPIIEHRCIHLDLKGVPPTPERLISLLRFFAAARYTSVLVEWEDTFPWTVNERFQSETAYSPSTVKRMVKTAADLGLELIPLVQCLGHMETVLRLPEYKHLRELPHDDAVMNPLARGARELIEKMVDDVLALMPGVKRFHLGGDEAWTFGSHPDTKKYISKHGKGALYLHHVQPLLDKLNRRKIRPLLWHDMMREWDSAALRKLARQADLVPWGYHGHPYAMKKHCNQAMFERFVKHGLTLWGGTAYKGACGIDADLPNIAQHEANAVGWMEAAQRHGFAGVIATAWSRYWTSACQNEPIDGALDSALNVGVILHDGKPPKGGIEACRRELKRIGEGIRFGKVKAALDKMSESQNHAWTLVRVLRRMLVTLTRDPRRLPAGFTVKHLKNLQDQMVHVEAASGNLRKALSGLMEPLWIDRYIEERVESLREEFDLLETRYRQISPEAHAALIGKK